MSKRIVGGACVLLASILFLATAVNLSAQDKKADAPPKKVAPPYPTAQDKPLDAKEEVVERADDHTQLRVEFNGVKGDRVPAYLYLPKLKPDAKAAPLQAVLLQYGSGGNKKTDYIVAIGKQFVARNFVVLTIDSPNCGERRTKEQKPNPLGPLALGSPEMVMHYCGDYSRAVDFLATRKEVNTDRIGYVGLSWGAITGITYVAHDPRIKAMASMVGGGNFLGQFSDEKAKKIAADGYKSSDPVYHVGLIAPRPLLFVNVTKDQMILKFWAESLHKAAGDGSKVVWLDTDHYFKTIDRAAACNSVIDFMDQKLCMKPATDSK